MLSHIASILINEEALSTYPQMEKATSPSEANQMVVSTFQYNKLNAVMRGVGTSFTFPQRYTTWAALVTALNRGKWKLQADILGTFVREKVRNNVQAPDKSELSPAFIAGYKPFHNHDFNVRAFYKCIFRLPTFNALYYAQIGSSQLNPEYSHLLFYPPGIIP